MVSTHQFGSSPEVGVKMNIFETTTQLLFLGFFILRYTHIIHTIKKLPNVKPQTWQILSSWSSRRDSPKNKLHSRGKLGGATHRRRVPPKSAVYVIPETNSKRCIKKWRAPKQKGLSFNHPFSGGKIAVSFTEGIYIYIIISQFSWWEDDPFLLGFGNFSREMLVSRSG